MDKLYNNNKDGWKHELWKLDQKVPMTTKLLELEDKLQFWQPTNVINLPVTATIMRPRIRCTQ